MVVFRRRRVLRAQRDRLDARANERGGVASACRIEHDLGFKAHLVHDFERDVAKIGIEFGAQPRVAHDHREVGAVAEGIEVEHIGTFAHQRRVALVALDEVHCAFEARLFRAHAGGDYAAVGRRLFGIGIKVFEQSDIESRARQIVHRARRRLGLVPRHILAQPIAPGQAEHRQDVEYDREDLNSAQLFGGRQLAYVEEAVHPEAERDHAHHQDRQHADHADHRLGDRGLGVFDRKLPAPAAVVVRGEYDRALDVAAERLKGVVDVLRRLFFEQKVEFRRVGEDLYDREDQREHGRDKARDRRDIKQHERDDAEQPEYRDRGDGRARRHGELFDGGRLARYAFELVRDHRGALRLLGRSRQTGTGGVDHLCGKVVDELAVLLFLIHFPAP